MRRQVETNHYFCPDYDAKARWASYWHQIHEVLSGNPANCLEVGGGNGTVALHLRSRGVDLVRVDIDPALGPDRVGDVRALPCADGEFDFVLCAEVLEHIPFDDVVQALSELRRVCQRRLIVSIPQTGRAFELAIRFPGLPRAACVGKLPSRHAIAFDGQHHWELGTRDVPLSRIRGVFSEYFTIVRDYLVPENPYHHFYILEPEVNRLLVPRAAGDDAANRLQPPEVLAAACA